MGTEARSRGEVVTPQHRRPKDWRLDVVRAVNYFQQVGSKVAGGMMADAVLELHGYPPKQADRVLEDAADEGLIEYGVSARTGWLTDKGRRILWEIE